MLTWKDIIRFTLNGNPKPDKKVMVRAKPYTFTHVKPKLLLDSLAQGKARATSSFAERKSPPLNPVKTPAKM